MRPLVYYVACTADGFIAREDHDWSFFPPAPDLYAHIAEEYPETIPTHLREAMGAPGANRRFDTVVMGRATYEGGSKLGFTNPYAHLRQYVVSSSMEASPDPAVTLVRQDPRALARALKGEDGLGIWLCGGGALAGALYDEIDELILKVNPVVVGAGIPLFRRAHQPRGLELVEHRTFGSGVAIHRYRMT